MAITTRSPGFRYHAYPHDYWRYTTADMALIFSDFDIELLEEEQDWSQPGVFVKARKPAGAVEVDLGPIALTSILTDDRRIDISDLDIARYKAARRANLALKPASRLVPAKVKAPLKRALRLGPGVN